MSVSESANKKYKEAIDFMTHLSLFHSIRRCVRKDMEAAYNLTTRELF